MDWKIPNVSLSQNLVKMESEFAYSSNVSYFEMKLHPRFFAVRFDVKTPSVALGGKLASVIRNIASFHSAQLVNVVCWLERYSYTGE